MEVTLSVPVKSNIFLNGEKCRGEKALLGRLKVSSRIHHGDNDDVIPLRASQQMAKALERAGADVKFTRYPDLMHDCWSAAYSNLEAYQWILARRRMVRRNDVVVPEAERCVSVEGWQSNELQST